MRWRRISPANKGLRVPGVHGDAFLFSLSKFLFGAMRRDIINSARRRSLSRHVGKSEIEASCVSRCWMQQFYRAAVNNALQTGRRDWLRVQHIKPDRRQGYFDSSTTCSQKHRRARRLVWNKVAVNYYTSGWTSIAAVCYDLGPRFFFYIPLNLWLFHKVEMQCNAMLIFAVAGDYVNNEKKKKSFLCSNI